MTFLAFVTRLCALVLTVGQRVLCEVLFDGVDPVETSYPKLAASLFGGATSIPSAAWAVVLAVCGRGSGKSYLGALRLLHLGLTVDLGRLAPGEVGFGIITAPSMRLARQTLRFLLGAVEANASLSSLVVSSSSDALTLRRPDGRLISFECFAASARGAEQRGKSIFGALLDEAALFRDENYKVNDAEIFRAIIPRLLPGGQILLLTTPWAKEGLVWELFLANHGHAETAVVAHAPTNLLRPDPETLEMVRRETARDADNAMREFYAHFLEIGSNAFLDPRTLEVAASKRSVATTVVSVGADFGFRVDSSALVVVGRAGGEYVVLHVEEMRPTREAALDFNVVVDRFAQVALSFDAHEIIADLHYAEAVRARLREHHVTLASGPEGATGKLEQYVGLKKLLQTSALAIPASLARMHAQLRAVESRPTAGGGLSISSPRVGFGSHGDQVSALVLALWDLGTKPEYRAAPLPPVMLGAQVASFDGDDRSCSLEDRPAFGTPEGQADRLAEDLLRRWAGGNRNGETT